MTAGCTGVPDLRYRDCCDAHDRRYETHSWRDGRACTRLEADLELYA